MTFSIDCPGSKSMTQRALVIAALSDVPVTLRHALRCDDSHYLSQILRQLGTDVRWNETDDVQVVGKPLSSAGQRLYCGNAGTAMRFSVSLSLLAEGELLFDGDDRMRERPIGPAIEALKQLGVQAAYIDRTGYPPLRLVRGSAAAEAAEVDGSQSSQFASGLLLVAPHLPRGLSLHLRGEIVSKPYLTLTIEMMRRAGINVDWQDEQSIRVKPGRYNAPEIAIEADWSTAAFIYGAAQIAGVSVKVENLPDPSTSLQGDAAFLRLANQVHEPHDKVINLLETPDLLPPLAALALLSSYRTQFTGIAHTRIKECDRPAVLARAFLELGARASEEHDRLTIAPLLQFPTAPVSLDPAGDHRMAMTFGLLSLRIPSIQVLNPACVSKSYPEFWAMLNDVRQSAVD